jgi:3-deoxy-D-manno-octulosonic acid kinase
VNGRFERIRRGPDQLLIAAAPYADAVRSMASLEIDELEADNASNSGPTGRGATRRAALPGHGERLLVRRYRHGGWLAGLLGDRMHGAERAERELRVTDELRRRGVDVPEPVLVMAQRRGVFWRAAIATVWIEGGEDLGRWLSRAPDRVQIVETARAAGRCLRCFHDAGGRHADLHAGNVVVEFETGVAHCHIVDLDGAQAGAPLPAARRMRELMRLERSLHKRHLGAIVGARGRAAFFGAYCNGDRALRTALLRQLRRERLRLAAHSVGWRLGLA